MFNAGNTENLSAKSVSNMLKLIEFARQFQLSKGFFVYFVENGDLSLVSKQQIIKVCFYNFLNIYINFQISTRKKK